MKAELVIKLLLLSIITMLLDHFYIHTIRDNAVVYINKELSLLTYRITNYPLLLLLETKKQQELARKNVELTKKLEALSFELKQNNNSVYDNALVHEINKSRIYTLFTTTIARAVIDVNLLINNQLLIDKGSNDGISVGNAVVNQHGVIGQVIGISSHNARVQLLTNRNFQMYLQHSVSKIKTLAQGNNHEIEIHFLDKAADIKINDMLETTGLDDVYPAHIPVAKITNIIYENNGFNSAVCKPIVNFQDITYVMVLEHVK